MAVTNAMFIFEVVVERVNSLVESRFLMIRSDFADIFSLELKDPKQMYIVIPEPPPLPPEPKGKKKKKKKPPKKKKGKKGKIEEPPPEPSIQSGQSVLFSSTAEFLIQNMKKYPLEVSLWSKEDNLTFIGSNLIPWDPVFVTYLEKIANFQEPPPVTIKDDYNIFEEGKAKLMAKIGLQIKLSYLGEKVTTSFRTLSEDPSSKKCLYTGINSKTTSYVCTMKTTDEVYEENCNKIDNNFVVDTPKPKPTDIVYADYKNAPAANLSLFNEGDYCCMSLADKPPDSIYKSPETCPDINFIVDYVRKIIVSCNDNMRMLTPRPTIRPRVKATDIDRYCYCKETAWPDGEFAERFRKEAQAEPCPMCMDSGKSREGNRPATFDLAHIRGPCGRADCRIARDMRAYITNLVEEDNEEFNINEVIGPCGSKSCILANKIQQFIMHEGEFQEGQTKEGLSTQCNCVEKMQNALTKKRSCESECSKDCKNSDSDASQCNGKGCPFKKPELKVYPTYFFTVQHDFEHDSSMHDETTPDTNSPYTATPEQTSLTRFPHCPPTCPSVKFSENIVTCSKRTCATTAEVINTSGKNLECPDDQCLDYTPSPADSDVVINFTDINNPCCVKTCDVAERIKDFIVDSIKTYGKKKAPEEDPCYCDCVCTFKFSNKTTYCAVCGGYECLGEDMKNEPDHVKPHPCPIYHKLYNKDAICTKSPWPEEEVKEEIPLKQQPKHGERRITKALERRKSDYATAKERKEEVTAKISKTPKVPKTIKAPRTKQSANVKKKVGKFTANVEKEQTIAEKKTDEEKKPKGEGEKKAKADHYPTVPKSMGWNWLAEDVPGMKTRPKWKPGAANKILVRKYKAVREGIDTKEKKKRALMNRKKKIEYKPHLLVQKKDGEYTVQMEVFKKYSKERLQYQYPYEDKPPITYTIGKTPAEKLQIQKKRERRERRETRRKSRLLQSTFRDKCQEICLKAYNQAMGFLPLPNPNDPECPCQTNPNPPISPQIDSCSCSDEVSISTSDTDGDEWIIEFTPPLAKFDPKAKHPPVVSDNETQYTYLDYKVKVLDKSGNQVPRYFDGPDGKRECSDLGGFWGPGHVWLEINKDGYIGPDNRWVPMSFYGPDGILYGAEEGIFTDANGKVYTLGVDGYVDKDGKWAWYKKKPAGVKSTVTASTNKEKPTGRISAVGGKGKGKEPENTGGRGKEAVTTGSKSIDKSKGRKSAVSHSSVRGKSPLIMSVSMDYEKSKLPNISQVNRLNVDPKKMAKYLEIMKDLQMYEDFHELKSPPKTNRASNTPRKRLPQARHYSANVMQVSSYSRYNFRQTLDSIPDSSTQCLSHLVG